jgi:hypothetical protein
MKFKPGRLSNQKIEYGKTKYKPVDIQKALLVWEALVLGIAYTFAHNNVPDFIGFFIGGQFFVVYIFLYNYILKGHKYVITRKNLMLKDIGMILSLIMLFVWAFIMSPWLFMAWDKSNGIDSDATFVSYKLVKFAGKHQYRVSKVTDDTALYVNITYSGHKAQIDSNDPKTENRWLNALENGDGLHVRFLSHFPSIVFSTSQLGLQQNDIINLHNLQPLHCPKPAPGAIPLNCTIDTPSYN